jgi:hypothetical protein
MMRPQWLDGVIEAAIKNGYDGNAIAGAIAHSPRFMSAIQAGIESAKAEQQAKEKDPALIGATPAQLIRAAIQREIAAVS